MKKTFIIVLTLSFGLLSNAQISEERKIAYDLLNVSLETLNEAVKNLTEEEANYIPKKGGWSVKNCLEHLVTVEPFLLKKIKSTISENGIDLSKDLRKNDAIVIVNVTNRSNKVDTHKQFKPKAENINKTKDDFLVSFNKRRKETLKFLKTTDIDLRHVFSPYPYGQADMVQQFLVMAAHSYRHIMQIKEIISEQKSL